MTPPRESRPDRVEAAGDRWAAITGSVRQQEAAPLDLPASLRVTGEVLIDLTEVTEDKARHRAYYGLYATPPGATVVLVVGTLAVNVNVLAMFAEYGQSVAVRVVGDGYAVRRWVAALRGDAEVIS